MAESLLYKYIVGVLAKNQIELVSRIIQQSSPLPQNKDPIIEDQETFLQIALDSVYVCKQTDCWDDISFIFESIPEEITVNNADEYQKRIDEFEKHLEAGEILASK